MRPSDDLAGHAHPLDDDKLKEECGVFGVIGVSDAANFVALGMHALQHRGQEAGGIVTTTPKRASTRPAASAMCATISPTAT
jgi:glutamine phosphoribosylpyrophosphate amidotransferase